MKIWIQSGTPLNKSDLYKPYADSLTRHAARVARPGTTVDFPHLGKEYPGAGRSHTHLHLVTHETIKAALRDVAGGSAEIDLKVDPEIIGGLVVQIGSKMVDSSLRTKLNGIRTAMKEVG